MTSRSLCLLAAALLFSSACASGDSGADTPTPEVDTADLSARTTAYFALDAAGSGLAARSNHPFLCSDGVRASRCVATLDWSPLGPTAATASLDRLARDGRLVVRGSWAGGSLGVREVLVRAAGEIGDEELGALGALVPASSATAAGLCGEELRKALETPVAGLLWPSESDYPISVILGAPGGTGAVSLKAIRALAGAASSATVEARGLVPLDQLGQEYSGIDEEGKAQAARFRALRAALEANLSGLGAYYVGKIDLRVVVVGRSRCGEIAGVVSEVIET